MTDPRSAASEQEIVWIPSVPLPLFGWRTDRCSCGMRFRGRGRQAAYELHYRREHQRGDTNLDAPQVGVTRAEAKRIYAEVNADSIGTTSDSVNRDR